jgi:hypothetical protein
VTRFSPPPAPDQPCRAVIRRCGGAPVLAVLSGCTPAFAARAAWLYCRNTQTYGFIVQLETIA